MRRNLAAADLGDLLELPLVAILATHRANGEVLLSPVWHEWRDGGFDVVTGSSNAKARHLRRDSRASIIVCESDVPYRGIEVRGRAQLHHGDMREIAGRLATRYLGAEGGAEYAKTSTEDTLIRLEPGVLRAWDFADDFG
jgi:PPOX class probable F420-dependent enzyme